MLTHSTFLARSLKTQSFQYADAPDVKALLEPILQPYLADAENIDYAEREGADHALSTRVSPTTFERFQVIVGQMAVERPDITPSAHLREIIEAYCERGIVPAPTVSISDPKQARDTIVNAVTDLLRDLGYTGL
ncbi:hypothetical protein C3Z06_31605 (plasmid) [Cupriavidus metallidurans]|nr:hypothetical protein C3Z06_31605 [Cupriavidus metallidurans]